MAEQPTGSSPQIVDKRPTPPGVLPKNAQAWIVTGIAVVMVGAIALSGRNPPAKPPEPVAATAAIDPNGARIQEYQKRIEDETRKLQLEQSQLSRSEESFRAASASESAATSVAAGRGMNRGRHAVFALDGTSDAAVADPFQADKEKREYQSLFASNMALSYRKGITAAQDPLTPTSIDALAKILPLYSALAALQQPGVQAAPGKTNTSPPAEQPVPDPKNAGKNTPEKADAAERPKYRLFEGTVLETVLTNRLDGSFSGPVNCMVTTNVYSQDGQHLLIPQGSRVLGEVHKVDSFGQERLAVSFHRLIMPDGYSVNLDQFQGLNQIGETGLSDLVNHHYLQVFGISLAIGAIAGLGEANIGTAADRSGLDAYEQGVASSLSQSSLRILDRYLNVLPTFTIREGHRVKVYLSQDLLLPAYDRHWIPSND